ncbi:MAG: hypothetical protein ACM3U2_19300 [Deltaproteobacteria bacterium]
MCSEEKGAPSSDAEQTKKDRAARLDLMRGCAASLVVKMKSAAGYAEVEIVDVPVLHYTNPAGETLDATIWAWGRRGRPVALASISQEKSNTGIEKWSCELLSLSDQPVRLAAKPGWMWAPAASGIEWKPVADAPAPGETPVVRGRQMRDIAHRCTAAGIHNDGRDVTELRLMERPLSRFTDPEHGLIDGVIYAFAGGTYPEVLLIVECRRESDGTSVWHHGFARMGADRLAVRLGEKVVWERPEIKRWIRTEPYFSTYGPLDEVFGSDK